MTKAKVLFVAQEITPYLEETPLSKIGRYLPQGIQERGKEIRIKHLDTLLTMYENEKIDKYYGKDNIVDSETRYTLYTLLVLATGIAAIGVPFVFLFFG